MQRRLIPDEPPISRLQGRTYIYLREDGKAVHRNAIGGFIGDEYEHDDPNWQPPDDWPYEVVDYRQEKR